MKINLFSTVHARITLAFFALITMILMSELAAYYRIKGMPNILAINAIRQDLTNLQKEEVSLKVFATEFILREKHNLAFFKTGESHFLTRYKKSLAQLNNDLDAVEKKTIEAGINEPLEMAALRRSLIAYDTLFKTMVIRIKERGYENFGIVGEFDNAIMDLVRHDFGADNVAILNLQLYVKEYLLSGNKGATNDVASEIYKFSTVIERYVKDEQVESVINSLSNYENSFTKLLVADEQLGTYTGEGLAKDLLMATAAMDEAVQLSRTQGQLNQSYSSVASQIYISIVAVTGMAILVAIVISWWLNRTIVKPFRKIKNVMGTLGLGEIPSPLNAIGLRDLNEMVVALNNLISSIKQHNEFADNIGKGNFTSGFNTMSDKDVLGKALLNMRDSLFQFDLENKQRTWVAQGIAQFADIFRTGNEDFVRIGSKVIITRLVEHLGVQMAGLYLTSEDGEGNGFVELISCYGFEKEKISERRIGLGQGLLGQAVVSRESIYVTPVPKDYYARISSGLGQALPKALFITPLKYDENVIGAIEVASLSPIAEYQRVFVEKVAENIASYIASLKMKKGKRMSIQSEKSLQDGNDKRGAISA
jgi:methyl-accepting chemotaxis protein